MITKKRGLKTLELAIKGFVFIGILTVYSCERDNTSTGPHENEVEVTEVTIQPDSVSFEVGEQQEFSAFLLSASGDTIDKEELNIEWNWYSSDPDVFTVQNNGTAEGQNPGEAFCIIEAEVQPGKFKANLKFVGRDSAVVFVF